MQTNVDVVNPELFYIMIVVNLYLLYVVCVTIQVYGIT